MLDCGLIAKRALEAWVRALPRKIVDDAKRDSALGVWIGKGSGGDSQSENGDPISLHNIPYEIHTPKKVKRSY